MFELKTLWTIVFALLQSVAPLLHAHAGGSPSTGFHMHVAPVHLAPSGDVGFATPQFPGESAAIGISDAHKGNVCTTCVADLHIASPLARAAKQLKLDFRIHTSTGACGAPQALRLPPSHAPPTRAA